MSLTMKKKFGKIISIVAAMVFFAGITSFNFQNQGGDKFRYVPNEAFGFGEKLEYSVGYKFITAGTGYFHILPEPVTINGRKCYDIRFSVRSLESLEWIYKVKNDYRTVMDVNGLFPWKFEQRQVENKYRANYNFWFDQEGHRAIVNKKDTFAIPNYVHDIMSAFFYIRALDLKKYKKGDIIYLDQFYKDTTYSLGVKFLGKETIDVEAGKFRCIVIEPLVKEGGLFKNDGSLTIWLTDDDRKIPVKVGSKILIGFVGAELTKYSGTRGAVKAKIE